MQSGESRPGVRRSRSSVAGRLSMRAKERVWESDIVDLSLSGMRSERPQQFDVGEGETLDLTITLDAGAVIRCQAVLVRGSGNELAFRFDPPLGPHVQEPLARLLSDHGRLRDDVDG